MEQQAHSFSRPPFALQLWGSLPVFFQAVAKFANAAHAAARAAPSQLVFGRNAMLNASFEAAA